MYNFECIFLCQAYFFMFFELSSYILKLSVIQGELNAYLLNPVQKEVFQTSQTLLYLMI